MIEAAIGKLERMSLAELRSEWRRMHKAPSPAAYTVDLLVCGIAYRLQKRSLGALPIDARRELDGIARLVGAMKQPIEKRRAGALRPGSRLVRRWRGATYIVAVTGNGFEFQDKSYDSLSVIAREITGTRWSGPRFFGCIAA